MELGQAIFGNPTEEYEAPDFIARDLHTLSEMLGRRDPDAQSHGVLGGEYGYGQDFANDVFGMFPYYWGECGCGYDAAEWAWNEEHDHASTCYQSALARESRAAFIANDVSFWDDENHYVNQEGTGDWLATTDEVHRRLCAEFNLPYPDGCAVHCTCAHAQEWAAWNAENHHDARCPTARPNFHHLATGLRVCWYKYIGRGMTANREVTFDEWQSIYDDCRASIRGA